MSALYDAAKQLLEPRGWGLDMIGDHQGFSLRPPADKDLPCPKCNQAMLEVVVMTATVDNHGHAMPCGCAIMPSDFGRVLQAGK